MKETPKQSKASNHSSGQATDTAAKNHINHLRLAVTLTILICLYESLTKGWASFYLLPASAIILPLFAVLQFSALKSLSVLYSVRLVLVSYLQAAFVLMFYVGVVGFGDTDEVLLFGFYTSTADTSITAISETISNFAGAAALIAAAALAYLTVQSGKQSKAKKHGA